MAGRKNNIYQGLPISGLSEVTGMIEETVFRNMVRERRIVTPANNLVKRSFIGNCKRKTS